MQKSAQDTEDFLEEERRSLRDELAEKETSLCKLSEKQDKLTADNVALQETLANLK